MNDETVKYWIKHSSEEVVKKLPKKIQSEYWEIDRDVSRIAGAAA